MKNILTRGETGSEHCRQPDQLLLVVPRPRLLGPGSLGGGVLGGDLDESHAPHQQHETRPLVPLWVYSTSYEDRI